MSVVLYYVSYIIVQNISELSVTPFCPNTDRKTQSDRKSKESKKQGVEEDVLCCALLLWWAVVTGKLLHAV